MGAPLHPPTQTNKVVVAFLDGRRVPGFIYNFSAVRDAFRVFPHENSSKHDAVEIKMNDLKAIFFVKDFIGNREYQAEALPELLKRGPQDRSRLQRRRITHRSHRSLPPTQARLLHVPGRPQKQQHPRVCRQQKPPPHQVPLIPQVKFLHDWPAGCPGRRFCAWGF